MHIPHRAARAILCLAVVLAPATGPALADFDDPKPRVDCRQKKNKTHPACQPRRAEATQDEIFNAAYWMNRSGRYGEAIDILNLANNPDDVRILNEMGFATRKLGNVDLALGFYRRALAADPGYVYARAYMGEALLIQGDVAAAARELGEIAARCGTSCTAYRHLAETIARYEARGTPGG